MNGVTYSFDTLDKSELPIVSEMAKNVILHNYLVFLGEQTVKEYINSKEFEEELYTNASECIVMKLNKKIIGFSILQENKIHLMMISMEHQNKGHGMKLLNHMENKLFKKYPIIELQSFTKNTIANNFYEKNGWQKTEVINNNDLSFNRYNKKK